MFRGVLTALVTPFRDGRIDRAALERLVEEQIQAGIDGLVPCGTTGESATLTEKEHVEVVEIVTRSCAGRVRVIAGAGSNDTRTALELTRQCSRIGVNAVLHITPYYNKPTQDGLTAHFRAIADASEVPVILYNVPGRTCVDMLPETVADLAAHPNVVGIKEATANMERVSRLRELCGDAFAVLSGDDATVLPLVACGGDGVISVAANCAPHLYAQLCRAALGGDLATARELHYKLLPLARAMFLQTNPIPVKTALASMGKMAPEMRLPLQIMGPGPARSELEAVLRGLELLP